MQILSCWTIHIFWLSLVILIFLPVTITTRSWRTGVDSTYKTTTLLHEKIIHSPSWSLWNTHLNHFISTIPGIQNILAPRVDDLFRASVVPCGSHQIRSIRPASTRPLMDLYRRTYRSSATKSTTSSPLHGSKHRRSVELRKVKWKKPSLLKHLHVI
jgi:hypothetical protein